MTDMRKNNLLAVDGVDLDSGRLRPSSFGYAGGIRGILDLQDASSYACVMAPTDRGINVDLPSQAHQGEVEISVLSHLPR